MIILPVDSIEQKTVLQELHVIIDEFDNELVKGQSCTLLGSAHI